MNLGHGLFPKIKNYYWDYFFEFISLIPLKKSELLYVWVTNKSHNKKTPSLLERFFLWDFQSGAL